MTSEKQTAANRRNAKKSTGPKTEEGKNRSRQNAVKHGLLARNALITRAGVAENDKEFEALLEALLADRTPVGPLEQLLTEQIHAHLWRLRRAHRADAENFANLAHSRKIADDDNAGERPAAPHKDTTDLLLRYEKSIERELHRALRELDRIQDRRRALSFRRVSVSLQIAKHLAHVPADLAETLKFLDETLSHNQPSPFDTEPGPDQTNPTATAADFDETNPFLGPPHVNEPNPLADLINLLIPRHPEASADPDQTPAPDQQANSSPIKPTPDPDDRT